MLSDSANISSVSSEHTLKEEIITPSKPPTLKKLNFNSLSKHPANHKKLKEIKDA